MILVRVREVAIATMTNEEKIQRFNRTRQEEENRRGEKRREEKRRGEERRGEEKREEKKANYS